MSGFLAIGEVTPTTEPAMPMASLAIGTVTSIAGGENATAPQDTSIAARGRPAQHRGTSDMRLNHLLLIGGVAVAGYLLGPQLRAKWLPRAEHLRHPDPQPQARRGGSSDDMLGDFFGHVLGNVNREFADIFAAEGRRYTRPVLVLYSGQTAAGCSGRADSRMGPLYCPEDQKLYLPTSLSREVRQRSGCDDGTCQFVMAVVTAHEIGHHVQNLLGLMRGGHGGPGLELQADCFAGVWASHENARLKNEGKPALIEPGDVEAAMKWQAVIGDDALMREAGRRVDQSQFTHGSGVQRQTAFQRGLRGGALSACNGRGA
jgi:predicted metalloprotease